MKMEHNTHHELEQKPRKLSETLPFLESTKEGEQFTPEQEQQFDEARANIAKQLGYRVSGNFGKFLTLEKEGYQITLKHFMTPSKYGLNGGRISEIQITQGEAEYTWDREPLGWVGKKPPSEVKVLVDELAEYLS